jgi:hypothetical protein
LHYEIKLFDENMYIDEDSIVFPLPKPPISTPIPPA